MEEMTGLWQYFEMGIEGGRRVRMEPRFLACKTRLRVMVQVIELQRVEMMGFIWVL